MKNWALERLHEKMHKELKEAGYPPLQDGADHEKLMKEIPFSYGYVDFISNPNQEVKKAEK